MSGFWSMGGYAAFVWPAYGVSAVGLCGAVLLTWKGWHDARARLSALEKEPPHPAKAERGDVSQ